MRDGFWHAIESRLHVAGRAGAAAVLLVASLIVSGCATLVKVVDNYPSSPHRGYALISGRNDYSSALSEYTWNLPVRQAVRGEQKQLGLLQIGEPRPPWVGLAPRNNLKILTSAPAGEATFFFGAEMNPITVDIHEDMTTRVTVVLTEKIKIPMGFKYLMSFDVEDPTASRPGEHGPGPSPAK